MGNSLAIGISMQQFLFSSLFIFPTLTKLCFPRAFLLVTSDDVHSRGARYRQDPTMVDRRRGRASKNLDTMALRCNSGG